MSTTLAVPSSTALAVSDDDFDALSEATTFLRRLQLYGKGEAINNRLIGVGEFGVPLGKNKIRSFGETVDLLVLARRAKALDMRDSDAIIVSYAPRTELFQAIQQRADTVAQNSGCMYGTSFLCVERTTGWFVEYFFGSKSTRPLAAEMASFLPLSEDEYNRRKELGKDVSQLKVQGPQAVTLKSAVAKNKKGSWFVPEVMPCSTPFSRVPSVEKLQAEIDKFVSEKGTDVQLAPEGTEKERVR